MSEPRPDPVQRFFGGALIAVGGLIATLCGVCSLSVIWMVLATVIQNDMNFGLLFGSMLSLVFLVPIVGGVPMIMGILIFRWGRRLYWPIPRIEEQIAVFSDEPAGDRDG